MNLMELISDKDSEETTSEPLSFGSVSKDPSNSLAEFLWLDGEIIPHGKAEFHIPRSPSPESTVKGNEGIRCFATIDGPALFRLDDNLRRFLNTIRLLGIEDFPYDLDSLRDAICRLVYANNLTECYIRPQIFFAGSSKYVQIRFDGYTIAARLWT